LVRYNKETTDVDAKGSNGNILPLDEESKFLRNIKETIDLLRQHGGK